MDTTKPVKGLEGWSLKQLTDLIGIEESAILLNTTKASIYTVRSSNALSIKKRTALIDEIYARKEFYARKLKIMNGKINNESKK